MTESEYLFTCLGEEAAEVTQAVSKLLRFGPEDHYPEKGMTNTEHLVQELNHIMSVVGVLVDRGLLPSKWLSFEADRQKREKVAFWLRVAKRKGCVCQAQPT